MNNLTPTSANMNLKYISSIVHPKDGPGTGLPEFAFIGRSNVGKSSLINMLMGRKSLAKVSGGSLENHRCSSSCHRPYR